MRYLLDTNIIIYSLKGSFPALAEHFASVPAPMIAVPAMVVAEIEYGARRSRDYVRTISQYRKFLSAFEIVPFQAEATLAYGKIRAALERGEPIGGNDLVIAATALANATRCCTCGKICGGTDTSNFQLNWCQIVSSRSLKQYEWKSKNKERVNFREVIGQFRDLSIGKDLLTTWGTIHYSKTGAHVVPAKPEEE